MNQKNLIAIVVVAIIAFGAGFYASRASVPMKKIGDKPAANTFEAGWQAAKDRLKQTGMAPMMDESMQISSASGQVSAVNGDKISVKINPLEPLADPDLDERTIEINENTKIYQLSEKNQEQYRKETEEFEKKIREQIANNSKPGEMPTVAASPVMPPELFVKTEIKLSDIKIGSQINVVSAGQDIKNAKSFTASEITVQPQVQSAVPAVTE